MSFVVIARPDGRPVDGSADDVSRFSGWQSKSNSARGKVWSLCCCTTAADNFLDVGSSKGKA